MKNTKTNKLHKFAVVGTCALMAVVNLSMNSESFASRDLASESELTIGDLYPQNPSPLQPQSIKKMSIQKQVKQLGEIKADVDTTKRTVTRKGKEVESKDFANLNSLNEGESFTIEVEYDSNVKVGDKSVRELGTKNGSKTITVIRKKATDRTLGNNLLEPSTTDTTAHFIATIDDCGCTINGESIADIGSKITGLLEEAAEKSAEQQIASKLRAKERQKEEAHRAKFEKVATRYKNNCNVEVTYNPDKASAYDRKARSFDEKLACLSDNAMTAYYDGNIPQYTQRLTSLFNTCMSQSRRTTPYVSNFPGYQNVAYSSRTSPFIMNIDDPYATTQIYGEEDMTSSYCQEAISSVASIDETGFGSATLRNLETYSQLETNFNRDKSNLNRWKNQQDRINPQMSDLTYQQHSNALEQLRNQYSQYIDYNRYYWEQSPQSYGANGMIQQWGTIGMTFDQMDQRLGGLSLRTSLDGNLRTQQVGFQSIGSNSTLNRTGTSARAWRGNPTGQVNTFRSGSSLTGNGSLNNGTGLRGRSTLGTQTPSVNNSQTLRGSLRTNSI